MIYFPDKANNAPRPKRNWSPQRPFPRSDAPLRVIQGLVAFFVRINNLIRAYYRPQLRASAHPRFAYVVFRKSCRLSRGPSPILIPRFVDPFPREIVR